METGVFTVKIPSTDKFTVLRSLEWMRSVKYLTVVIIKRLLRGHQHSTLVNVGREAYVKTRVSIQQQTRWDEL